MWILIDGNSKRETAYRERSISGGDPRPEVPEIN